MGQLKSAVYNIAPHARIIDLIHDLPVFRPKSCAYLLASFLEHIPDHSIVVGVVDPGVGSGRTAIVVESGGYTFIGPNNGLFAIITKKFTDTRVSAIEVTKEPVAKTFHGRDVFAPVAAQIAAALPVKCTPVAYKELIGADWPSTSNEIIYVDHFGNAVTGIAANQCNMNTAIMIKGHKLGYAETFSKAKAGECFWYYNSNNLIEIASREASAEKKLQLSVGDKVEALRV